MKIVVGGSAYEFCEPEIGKIFGEYYLKNQNEVLDGICLNENRSAVSSEVVFQPNAKEIFKITKPENGRRINLQKLKSDVRDALAVGGGTVYAEFTEIYPEAVEKDFEGTTELRSSFTTAFQSVPERVNNIRLATASISGTRIESGETFSFNEVVGERTEKRGYKAAKIIVNGEFVEGVGGGVCQVSTTLYNAALKAGLEIVERHRHTLAVSYIEPSFDAMVNSGSSDLKFKNNTDRPIYVAGYVNDGSVTFKIYGTSNPLTYVREYNIIKRLIAENSTVVSPELKNGESRVVVEPRDGMVTEGYLSAYRGNELVWKKKVSEDKYLAVNGVTEIGKEDKNNENHQKNNND